MSNKIDERLPQHIGQDVLASYPAIRSPWGKLVGYQEAMHYLSRYNAVISSSLMQVLRILMPDYEARSQFMCAEAYGRMQYLQRYITGKSTMDQHNVHPFCRGNFMGALNGDNGDESLLMPGRCNDFGTYRVEKELDVCDWDIIGSELCRATTQSLNAIADVWRENLRPGPRLEYHMVEAKGCGDCHCRIVAECREKYPMPPHEQWECFGPIATADQIQYTKEEKCVLEPQVFRADCDYTYASGTNFEQDYNCVSTNFMSSGAMTYIIPALNLLVTQGIVEEKTLDHVIRCVCEAAGKAAFGEHYAKEGLRQWLGAPHDVNDGRLMGGHIEMYLQSFHAPYEVEAFNKDEVIYVIDRAAISVLGSAPKHIDALKWTWYGMTRTLVNAQWYLWEEDSPEGKLRIKIAKKIDKFC